MLKSNKNLSFISKVVFLVVFISTFHYPVFSYLSSRESFLKWIHFIHNKINVQIGKEEITYLEFINNYNNLYKPKELLHKERFKQKEKYLYLSIISLLIGRFEELIKFSSYKITKVSNGVTEYIYIYSPTLIILVFMVVTLSYWAYKDKNIIKE